jgi:hypothetical protein
MMVGGSRSVGVAVVMQKNRLTQVDSTVHLWNDAAVVQ